MLKVFVLFCLVPLSKHPLGVATTLTPFRCKNEASTSSVVRTEVKFEIVNELYDVMMLNM